MKITVRNVAGAVLTALAVLGAPETDGVSLLGLMTSVPMLLDKKPVRKGKR